MCKDRGAQGADAFEFVDTDAPAPAKSKVKKAKAKPAGRFDQIELPGGKGKKKARAR